MSEETQQYLNTNTLIGFTEIDGNAWHWDGISQNQYPHAVPLADVKGTLFNWAADFRGLAVIPVDHETQGYIPIDTHQALVRVSSAMSGEDEVEQIDKIFGFYTDQYAIHQYDEWLLENVAQVLDVTGEELAIGSAGLLRQGAQAWVQIRHGGGGLMEVGGDQFLPYLLAATSHDGSIASTYRWCMQRVVCDNTLSMAMGERTPSYKVRHTTNGQMNIAEARLILDVFHQAVDEFALEVEQLMNTGCTHDNLRDTIKGVYGTKPVEEFDEAGKSKNIRTVNNWERRFDEIVALYDDDPRVGDFAGTQWGAVQAHNTWTQWGVAERDTNTRDTADVKLAQLQAQVDGSVERCDQVFLDTLLEVCSS